MLCRRYRRKVTRRKISAYSVPTRSPFCLTRAREKSPGLRPAELAGVLGQRLNLLVHRVADVAKNVRVLGPPEEDCAHLVGFQAGGPVFREVVDVAGVGKASILRHDANGTVVAVAVGQPVVGFRGQHDIRLEAPDCFHQLTAELASVLEPAVGVAQVDDLL